MNWNDIQYIKDTVARLRSDDNCPSCGLDSLHYLIDYANSIVYCRCGNYENIFTDWVIYKARDKNEPWVTYGTLNIFNGFYKKRESK